VVTDREGLLLLAAQRPKRDGAGTAVVAGGRARTGRRALPIATLASAASHPEQLFDLSTVPPPELQDLQERLAGAAPEREAYLSLLEALAQGDAQTAMALASRIAESGADPTKDLRSLIDPWLSQCRRYRERGLLEQARPECMIALSVSPADPEANLMMGDIHRLLGELPEARARYESVQERDVTSLGAALGLASIHELEGNYEEAEKLHPSSALLLNNLAALYVRMAGFSGLSDEEQERAAAYLARARSLFQASAALAPQMAEPRAGLAEVYSLLGEHERALAELDRAISMDPSCTFRGWRGQVLYELGRLDEAERELDSSLLSCPDHLPARVAKGNLLLTRGCYQQALQAWELVLGEDPDNFAARGNIDQLKDSGLLEFGDTRCGR